MYLRRAVLPALITASGLISVPLHFEAVEQNTFALSKTPQAEMLAGPTLRAFTLGQRTTLADLYWLKLVQMVGTPAQQQAGFPGLLPLAQLISDLDPEYGYPYVVAGLLLASVGRVAESNEILLKGTANAPTRWEIPFYLAFNYWYEDGDLEQGAKWLEIAAQIPGAPLYLESLAARLYSSAGQIDAAIVFTTERLKHEPSAERHTELKHRLRQLKIEQQLQSLERRVASFQKAFGRNPPDLASIGASIDPTMTVEYDPEHGRVHSPELNQRIALPKVLPEVRTRVVTSAP